MAFRNQDKAKQKAFDKSAVVIGEEMRKWDNFGVIYDNAGGYRVFCGGDSEILKSGIAEGIVHIAEVLGDNDLIVEILNRAKGIMIEHQSKMIM